MTINRLLVWATLGVFAVAIGLTLSFGRPSLPDAVPINAKGQPTIGYKKSKVHVVIFEEPKCSNCKRFNETIFPQIKQKYIDTNKIKYTVIPVSFLPGSMPAAVALLCVYYADPIYPNSDLFFTYLDTIYGKEPGEETDWATTETLVEFAKETSSAINLEKLSKCVDKDTYRSKIEKNTQMGRSLMRGSISTPTLYVNGIESPDLDFDSVSELIEKVLKHEGVH